MNSQPASQPESIDLAYDMWAGQFEFIGPTNNKCIQNNSISNNIQQNNNSNNNNNVIINNKNLNRNFNIASSDKNSSQNRSTESLEDLNLNLNFNSSSAFSGGFDINKQPILIDQETFLSLNPNDFDDIVQSGPNSLVFIENKLTDVSSSGGCARGDFEISSTSSTAICNNNNNCINNHNNNNSCNGDNKIVSIEALTNKFNCKPNNTNTNGFRLENLKNFKNKLLCDFDFTTTTTATVQDKNPIGVSEHIIGNNSVKMNGITAEICDNFNEQLELLQRQVTDLADTQNIAEDRTTRTKTEYAVLQARYHMLEEQYRESEIRAEERLAEEQKRHRELLARVEREAALQNENCQIKIKTIEIEANALREEAQRLRVLCDKQASDLHNTEEKLELARDSIAALQQDLVEAKHRERKNDEEKKAAEDLMIELSRELERLRSEIGPAMPTTTPETLRLEELHHELDELRQKNKNLEEQNEELQAAVLTRGVEEGRHLLNGTLNSLAQELEEMSQAQDSVDSATLASLSQLQQAFQDKEEENVRLKHYIDTILLNIVENYPQLLEVKAMQRN